MHIPETIHIRLIPKASSSRIGKTRMMPDGSEVLTIYVTEAPDKNKANEAMLRLLARYLDIAPSRLTILRGKTNRNKVVGIQ